VVTNKPVQLARFVIAVTACSSLVSLVSDNSPGGRLLTLYVLVVAIAAGYVSIWDVDADESKVRLVAAIRTVEIRRSDVLGVSPSRSGIHVRTTNGSRRFVVPKSLVPEIASALGGPPDPSSADRTE
jgi:hypothetical protein